MRMNGFSHRGLVLHDSDDQPDPVGHPPFNGSGDRRLLGPWEDLALCGLIFKWCRTDGRTNLMPSASILSAVSFKS